MGNVQFLRFGALLGSQLHHRSVLGGDVWDLRYEYVSTYLSDLAGNWIFTLNSTPGEKLTSKIISP
jgi:hypothetical protein